MTNFLFYLAAFAVVIGVLVVVHEYGHYAVARLCGVKVLRFSVGFGQPLWARRFGPDETEWAIGRFPLGGYVKMLDERDAPVAEEDRHQAFNTQPLASRALIVAAGPVANLVLAVLLYALVNWIGVQEPRALLSPPVAGSLADKAGLQGGELVRQAALAGEALEPVASFESLRWVLTRGALDGPSASAGIRLALLHRAGRPRVIVSAPRPPLTSAAQSRPTWAK